MAEDTEKDTLDDRWYHTVCAQCYGSCGMAVNVVDGVVVRVEGEPDSFMGSRGGLCGKGASSIISLYDPNRIRYPMKRTNPKKGFGEDPKWERISWEEAMNTIAEKHNKVLEKDPRALIIAGTPSPGTNKKFSTILSGLLLTLGCRSFAPGGVGLHCGNGAHFGAGLIHCSWSVLPDYRYCNYAIQFGSNKGTGSGHSPAHNMRLAAEARARGMRNIVFDPICNFAGGKATEWIPILPGTDLAVILAMCNIIVNTVGKYDEEFLKKYTNGPYLVRPDLKFVRDRETGQPLLWDESDSKAKTWDDPTLSSECALLGDFEVNGIQCRPSFQLLKEHLKQYEPAWAEKVSTVPASKIDRIAREFLEEARIGATIEIEGVRLPYRPVATCMFRGGQGHSNCFHQYFAICVLNQLVGNVEAVGGTISWPARGFGHPDTGYPRYEPYAGVDGMLTPGMWVTHDPWPPEEPKWPERLTLQDFFVHSHTSGHPYSEDFEEIWERAGRPYDCQIIAYMGGNLFKSTADIESTGTYLSKVPFSWGVFTEHNETTEAYLDIVLPEKHPLEQLDISGSIGYFFNWPTGMDDWSFHMRQPVVKNRYEERDVLDIMFDLADRLGPERRAHYNTFLDTYFSGKLTKWGAAEMEQQDKEFPIIGPDERLSNEEFIDRTLKHMFGEKCGLQWLREKGFVTWKKRPEEAYWRTFCSGRGPIYFEFLLNTKEKAMPIGEKLGIKVDWNHYTPLLTYFPSIIYEEGQAHPDYEFVAFSYRDILHAATATYQNPMIDEMSRNNPFTYNICLHAEAAKKKGIRDGDMICVENLRGRRMTGRAKLMTGIHPQAVASVAGGGGWAKGRPIAKNKGVMFNNLLINDMEHKCPVTLSIETAVRVKVYKVAKQT
ncbi:MAG: molybdopterin-dependent oxidoreductase [Deltaproteobacteria bacterium]|nr:MAG: molybdopterin-dependent oxidoreductase [Deltaproteobacteria bacterium]